MIQFTENMRMMLGRKTNSIIKNALDGSRNRIHVAYLKQGGHVVSVASNTLNGTAGYITDFRFRNGCTCHAEIGCIKNVKYCNRQRLFSKGLSLYSLAYTLTTKNGVVNTVLSNGKPCLICLVTMINIGVSRIYYSDDDGQIQRFDPASLNGRRTDGLNQPKEFFNLAHISAGYILNIEYNKLFENYNLFNYINRTEKQIDIFPRKKILFGLLQSDIVVFRYFDGKDYRNQKVKILEIKIGDRYTDLIRNIADTDLRLFDPLGRTKQELVKVYKKFISNRKTKNYLMCRFMNI
jgi:tRNA(Arg) A34 adenosine deaminase TadA